MAVGRKKLRWIALASGLVIIGLIILLLSMHKQPPQTAPTRSSSAINFSRTDTRPTTQTTASNSASGASLTNNTLQATIQNDDNPGGTKYTLTSSQQPAPGWYVVHLTAMTAAGPAAQVAILHADGSDVEVVAGPDTSFPVDYLQSIGTPQAVQDQVNTYVPD